MKKLLAVLTALFLLVTAVAFAENVQQVSMDQIKISAVVPEGYAFSGNYVSDILYVGNLTPSNAAAPSAMITIAYDEEAEGRTLNEFSEAELDSLITLFLNDTPNALVTKSQTGKGTNVLIFDTQTESESRYDIMTIWHGYQVALMVLPGENSTALTDEQKSMIMQFLTDVTIESN